MLSDLSPRFLAYVRLKVKHPVFLEALQARFVEGSFYLDPDPLLGALEKFKTYQETIIFGLESGFFGNEVEIRQQLQDYGPVYTVHGAIAEAKEDLGKL